jgi:two-component system response regulator
MTPPTVPVDILLVEDSDEDAELTIRALTRKRLANQLHRVVDGVEALDFLNGTGDYADRPTETPKLVLLDLKLPKVDGLEVLRQIKSAPRTQSIPVCVLTSSREDRDLIESYRLGVNSYIVKPVDFENFVAAARELGTYWLLLNQTPAA